MSREQRRDQVLKAALTVFARGGYAASTIDEVARQAGVSQLCFVRLFGSKQQLLLDSCRSASARMLDGLRGVAPSPGAVGRTVDTYAQLLEDRNLNRVLTEDLLTSASVACSGHEGL